MKNGKNILIAGLLVAIMVMSVGYAAFASQLNLNGTTTIDGEWDVEITAIKASNVTGDAVAGTPSYTASTATFNATLKKPGDAITYTVTVENKGNIDAKLNDTVFTEGANGSPAIVYTHTDPAATLAAGDSTTFTVTTTYDASYTETPAITTKTITGLIEYVQAD